MLSKRELVSSVSEYLLTVLNAKAAEKEIPQIVDTENGQTGSIEFSKGYPTLFVACNGRTLNGYFTDYDFTVGIALTAPTPELAEEYGDCWEDILEDIYRNDCHLGGLVLDIADSATISGQQEGGCWFVYSQMAVEMQNEE